MKHLNAIQLEIESLAGRIKPISDSQKEWAMHSFRYEVNIGSRDIARGCICPSCHKKMPIGRDITGAIGVDMKCPECGANINVYRNLSYETRNYVNHWQKRQQGFFEILSSVGDWQVCRLVWMQRDCYATRQNTDWYIAEVCQAWNRPDLPDTYFRSLPKAGLAAWNRLNPYSLFDYNYEQNENAEWVLKSVRPQKMEARLPNSENYFRLENIAPNGKIASGYRKIGVTMRAVRYFKRIGVIELMSGHNYSPMYETLLKGHAYALMNELRIGTSEEDKQALFTAYKICVRNGYDYTKNMKRWIDCVKMLRSLGMDYHNPVYVCPNNLDALHQQLLVRLGRVNEINTAMSKEEENEELQKRIAKYMGMDIRKNGIHIIVLPSIIAFKKEGDALGHCVYKCKYYNKPNSLILSARCGKKRLETIEVDIQDLRIRQCYGYGDKPSARHEEILSLMNDNMWQVKECRDGKTASVAS